jgi:glycosyltransferase involved in cell wall biosynthesis
MPSLLFATKLPNLEIHFRGRQLGENMFYFDISDLVNHANFSSRVNGIQRVVQEGLRSLSRAGDLKYFCLSFASHVAYEIKPANKRFGTSDLSEFKLIDLYCDLHQWKTARIRLGKFVIDKFGLRVGKLIEQAISLPLARTVVRLVALKTISTMHPHLLQIKIRPLETLGGSDRVFHLGGIWNDLKGYSYFFKNQGKLAKHAVFIHDVIPLRIAHVPNELTSLFEKFVPLVLENADYLITSTEFNKLELTEWASNQGLKVPKIKVIGLAHRFPEVFDKTISLRVKSLSLDNYVLCVGSIEPRKNHANLLLVWDKFRRSESYRFQKLVIAGHWGWEVESVQNALHSTGHFGGSVVVVERPSDAELKYLYENCNFSIYPSFYEGWGLPVGESLSLGKRVLAFNASAIPEVAQGQANLVEPYDLAALYKELVRLFSYETVRLGNPETYWRDWDDFGNEMANFAYEE